MPRQKKTSKESKKEYKIPSALQQYLTEEELGLYEGYFNTPATKKLRSKLIELFEHEVNGSYIKSDKENKYEMSSWSEYQADAIGYRRALKRLITFLQ